MLGFKDLEQLLIVSWFCLNKNVNESFFLSVIMRTKIGT